MFEGKRFLPETGMPILNKERKSVKFEVWLPEPFTVDTVIEKSFTISPGVALTSSFGKVCRVVITSPSNYHHIM
jgi:hypothetical protein